MARSVATTTGLRCVLSWPKDTLIRGRKVAGVLVEVEAEQDWMRHAVLGVGVNVNLDERALPSDSPWPVTSLSREHGGQVALVPLLRSLLQELDSLYECYLREGAAPIVETWRRWPNVLGSRVAVMDGDLAIGEAVELGPDGALLVRLDDGGLLRLASGQVRLAEAHGG